LNTNHISNYMSRLHCWTVTMDRLPVVQHRETCWTLRCW